ncbi:hypothetical protein LVY65_05535 [Sphingomonas sp. G124]|uniref:Uncharacterized protein n=1 Tax=Sphingomonas cremea TaxID=2904799 RepID=A0A9X1QIS6_9SPHN|nr:hypothetical protein [Sphingomonas cremea]MCF2514528.1 hypothetical protein [Sphingomonas cremea]
MEEPVETVLKPTQRSNRALFIGGGGVAIILLAARAAFMPTDKGWSDADLVATLLVFAGLIELAAGAARDKAKVLAMLAGAISLTAGLMLAAEPSASLVRVTYLIIAWLGLRSLVLFSSGLLANGFVQGWTILSAATDLILAIMILTGLAAAAAPIAFFGPTTAVISSFVWVLALSFVATGTYLIGVAYAVQRRL